MIFPAGGTLPLPNHLTSVMDLTFRIPGFYPKLCRLLTESHSHYLQARNWGKYDIIITTRTLQKMNLSLIPRQTCKEKIVLPSCSSSLHFSPQTLKLNKSLSRLPFRMSNPSHHATLFLRREKTPNQCNKTNVPLVHGKMHFAVPLSGCACCPTLSCHFVISCCPRNTILWCHTRPPSDLPSSPLKSFRFQFSSTSPFSNKFCSHKLFIPQIPSWLQLSKPMLSPLPRYLPPPRSDPRVQSQNPASHTND